MRCSQLIAAIVLIGLSSSSFAAERPAPAVTEVQVELRQLERSYSTTGILESKRHIELRSEVSGKIAAIFVEPTALVQEGELLLEIDSRSQATELKRLEIDLQLAQQRSNRLAALASNRSTSKEALEVAQAEAASLRAEIQAKQLELESHQIRAPFNGVLGNFDWESASLIEASSLFTTLDDMSELEVQFDLPERFLSELKIGQSVEMESNAWPDQQFQGRVALIEPRFDADRATLTVEAVISNDQQKLRPGMRVKVSLVEKTDALSLLVPARSLIHDRNQTQVLKLNDKDIPSLQLVTTGRATDNWIEILTGLDVGDRVVDRGVVKARPQQPVNILNKSDS